MSEINDVKIESIEEIGIPPVMSIFTGLPEPITPQSPPVTVTIGTPIVNIPGCVEAHLDGTGLIEDDPDGTVTLCDGQLPSFNPINYDPNRMVLTGPPEPEPKAPKLESPKPPPIPETPLKTPVPNIPIVTVEEEEEVVETVEVVEEPTFVEKYLPTAEEVSTTVTIAVAAASAAVFGKPLAELLLKLIKPLVRRVIQKAKDKIGIKVSVLSVSERRQLQRDLRK